ncbi:unnamed protein product [Rotaria sp. Silwood1]|nr:unnamed protein product [Rotaria sp. Silwood1]CAF4827750.1 unnamed protein product [Rotaria sp. Silwood1]
MKLSSSSISIAFNIHPNIDFLIDEPVLIAAEEPLFDITNEKVDVNNMATRLACQSTAMLKKIMKLAEDTGVPFNNKFRLELRPASFFNKHIENNLWQLRMNVDPVNWFDLQWHQCNNNEENHRERLAKARSYIQKYRSFVAEEMRHTPLHEPIIAPDYCGNRLTCKNKNYYPDHARHANIICKAIAKGQRNDGDRECGQYLMNEYIVMEWPVKPIMQLLKDKTYNSMEQGIDENFDIDQLHFIFTANKETIRDLVIFPMPPWHLSNKDLIQLPLFWATVIIASKMLHRELQKKLSSEEQMWPIEAIGINFGEWETAGSYDKRHIDCHGHAHLLLTLSFMNACDDTFFRVLKGRVNQPPDYLRQNAHSLQFERLQNHEFDSKQMASLFTLLTNIEEKQNEMYKDLQMVKKDMQGVKEDMQGVKEDMQGLKEDMQGLKKDMQGVKEDMQGLKKDMQDVKKKVNDMKALLGRLESLLQGKHGTSMK